MTVKRVGHGLREIEFVLRGIQDAGVRFRAVLDPTLESAPEYDFILFFSYLTGYSNSGSFAMEPLVPIPYMVPAPVIGVGSNNVADSNPFFIKICIHFCKYVYALSV